MPCVYIPANLRELAGGAVCIHVTATTVGGALDAVDTLHPGLQSRLCDGTKLRSGVMLSIDGRLATLGWREPVEADSEIHFLPAIGGG